MFEEIKENLKALEIEFNPDQESVKESLPRIQHLITILKMPDIEDCDVTREAYHMLRHMGDDQKLQHLLADDVSYFSLEHKLESYEKTELGLQAALVGAQKLAEAFFNEDFNPKKNADFLPYAIASGEVEWVKSLVDQYGVNIHDPIYLFRLQAERFSKDLLEFYNTCPVPVPKEKTSQ